MTQEVRDKLREKIIIIKKRLRLEVEKWGREAKSEGVQRRSMPNAALL